MDIVHPGTGFLAESVEEYAECIAKVLVMHAQERRKVWALSASVFASITCCDVLVRSKLRPAVACKTASRMRLLRSRSLRQCRVFYSRHGILVHD